MENKEKPYNFLKNKILNALPAFKNKNYRLYFAGQLISLCGTWLQIVAQGWLVYELTHSALWVGIIFALNSIPVTIFVLFGGVVVDRLSKRKIIIFTQSLSMILALILGILTLTNTVTVIHIALLTFLLGVVNALDMPARQAFMNEIVKKNELSSAIAMNAGVFNAARAIGPVMAGALILFIGAGGAFIANGLSFIPAIISLLYIVAYEQIPETHPHPIAAIKEGIAYSNSHPIIRDILILAGLNSIFGWSYITIMPVIAKNVFNLNADGLSYLYAASGAGAVLGTILVSAFSHKVHPSHLILGGVILFASTLLLFSFTNTLFLGLPLLFLSGLGLVVHFSMMNTTIQHIVPRIMLGRVLSIYTFMFLGLSFLGSFQIGFISEHFGSQRALQINSIIALVFAFYQLIYNKKLKSIIHLV